MGLMKARPFEGSTQGGRQRISLDAHCIHSAHPILLLAEAGDQGGFGEFVERSRPTGPPDWLDRLMARRIDRETTEGVVGSDWVSIDATGVRRQARLEGANEIARALEERLGIHPYIANQVGTLEGFPAKWLRPRPAPDEVDGSLRAMAASVDGMGDLKRVR
jgi:hypothetical protein